MKKLSGNFRRILLWGTLVSLIFNTSILLLFFYLIESLQITALAISGLFLVIFLFVLQPIRDQLLSQITERIIFSSRLEISKLEEKASLIANLNDGISFLCLLAEQWRLPRIRMALYAPRQQLVFITGNGSRVRTVEFRRNENQEFFSYLKNFPKPQNTYAFPAGIRNYLYNRKIRCVIPIGFRDNLFGFIGLPNVLDEHSMETVEIAAQRIGIAIENEKLKSNQPRSALLGREFYLARRVETFLSRTDFNECHGYRIQKIESSWKKKYFAVILEIARPALDTTESNPFFMILIRLASSSIRSNALQLFAVQGYFLALAAGTPSVELLAEQLHLSLSTLENGKITLDGFIVAIERDDLRLVHFGSHLALKTEGEWIWLEDNPAMGSPDYSLHALSLGRPANIHFSIREYPLVALQMTGVTA